jgi:hypothetical protein
MKLRVSYLLVLLAVVALPGFSANLIVNGGFELPLVSSGPTASYHYYEVFNPNLTGWTIIAGTKTSTVLGENGVFEGNSLNPDIVTFTTPYGNQHLDLTGTENTSGGITQNISVIAGQTYIVRWSVGNVGYGAGSGAYCLVERVGGVCPPGQLGSFYEGAAQIDLVINGAGISNQTFSSVNTQVAGAGDRDVAWQTFTTSFTPTTSGTVSITFNNMNVGDNYAGLDNVSVDAIPEPATIALMGLGLIGIGALRRRLQQK